MKIFLFYILLSFTGAVSGIRRGKRDPIVPENLTQCPMQAAIFLHGFCIKCITKNSKSRTNLVNASCNFTRSKSQPAELFTLFSTRKNETCPNDIVGCLNLENIEGWLLVEGRSYLKGRRLQVVTLESHIFFRIKRHPFVKLLENGEYSGVCFELMRAMGEKYNFSMYYCILFFLSMHIFQSYDRNWGTETQNGSWNGMVAQVIRKEADIGVAGFSVTLERHRVISFTSSFYQEETGILIPPPTEASPRITILIRPLSPLVWASLLVTICILTPTLYTMHVISLNISGLKSKQSFNELFGEILHFMIGSLVQESVISPVNQTTRFLIILWWFLTLIVANIYVGYLVSYLSAPKLVNIVDTLEDLVQQSTIKWTFREGTAHQSLFKSKSSGIYKQVGDGVRNEDLVQTDAAGVSHVLSGEFAFIKEKSFLDVALGQDFIKAGGKCRLTIAKQKFFKVETALIVGKQSKIHHLVNLEINRAVTSGLMEKWKSLHWEQLLWCEDAVNFIPTTFPATRKLDLSDFLGAWFLFGCGNTLAIIGLIGEFVAKKIGKFGSAEWEHHVYPAFK